MTRWLALAFCLPQAVLAATITLRWSPVTTMDDAAPIPFGLSVSYNVYGGHSAVGPFRLAANVLSPAAVRPNVSLGLDCYQVTAVVNGKEGLPSDVACVTVTAMASSIPSKPLNLQASPTL